MSDEPTASIENKPPSYALQVIGSLLAALLIVIVTISVVTAKVGEGDTRERYEERQEVHEQREERQELREEQREERDKG